MKAVILAAGFGKRMKNLTSSAPKAMIEVAGKPLIMHVLEKVRSAGIFDVVINVAWQSAKIIEHFGNGENIGMKITYSNEGATPIGTASGIKRALKFIGDKPFWLVNADVISDFEFRYSFKLKEKYLGHLILVDNPEHNLKGDFDLQGKLVVSKKSRHDLTFSGISFLSPKIFEDVPNKDADLESVLLNLAERELLSGDYYSGQWLDVGDQIRLNVAENFLRKLNVN